MRACWDATILVLVQPFPASCATCRGTSDVPRVLALTHRHLHKSPCVRQPFVEISGSIASSSLWFLSRKLCPIFVCQFKGSLHFALVISGRTKRNVAAADTRCDPKFLPLHGHGVHTYSARTGLILDFGWPLRKSWERNTHMGCSVVQVRSILTSSIYVAAFCYSKLVCS